MAADLLSVREVAAKTGRSEQKIRALINTGKVEVVRIGYNLLVPISELKKVRDAKYRPHRKD